MQYTAKITGVGADSSVPDNSGAVDAAIYADGVEVGAVTLLPDRGRRGELAAWGRVDHWADSRAVAHLNDAEDRRRAIGAIVCAVKEAHWAV